MILIMFASILDFQKWSPTITNYFLDLDSSVNRFQRIPKEKIKIIKSSFKKKIEKCQITTSYFHNLFLSTWLLISWTAGEAARRLHVQKTVQNFTSRYASVRANKQANECSCHVLVSAVRINLIFYFFFLHYFPPRSLAPPQFEKHCYKQILCKLMFGSSVLKIHGKRHQKHQHLPKGSGEKEAKTTCFW